MKRKVLETLKINKGAFISGEEISNKMGVTRTAVWKQIKQLKKEGYGIESVSGKGYRLTREPDTLDASALEIELQKKSLWSKVVHFDSIESTNTIAKKLAAEGQPEGTIIIAEEQTGGRGRRGKDWLSPKGTGIWMSMLLRPDIDPSESAKITQIAAAAVTMAIQKITGCQAGIKWPNDIILHRKKVCGILTEMSGELSSINYIIVGIGINANVDIEVFPMDIRKIATSIKACIGKSISRKDMVIAILNEFEKFYFDFIEKKNIKKAMSICKKYSVTLGNQVRLMTRGEEIIAEAIDLTEEGELVIKKATGEIEKVISGEVSVRGIADYI